MIHRVSTAGEVWARPVVLYVALAYLISWSWWIPLALTGQEVVRGDATPSHMPGLLGPMLAAALATGILAGRAGLANLVRSMVLWRVGWRWWLAAFSPLTFAVVALPVARVVDGEWPAWSAFGEFNGLPNVGALGTWVLITALNGLGEETGWRGYLLPHLQQRLSPLSATLLLAGIWALWHAPMFFFVESFESMSPVMLPMWVTGLAFGAVVLTWLYNRSGGSVLLVAVWHGSYNVVSGSEGAEGVMQVVVSGLVVALAIHLIAREREATGNGPLAPISNAQHPAAGP